ncbi:oxidoreductase-like domain-containing protein [Thalassotalea euphylliae]|uniref:oxidoreductase-like domain-containing protein n=1 Tax=Thalassotalea euphylliae TaxID=1655234 RepID=UPI00362BBF24
MSEEIIEKPTPPGENECCDSACTPCVWDIFYEKRRKWRIQEAERREKEKQSSD